MQQSPNLRLSATEIGLSASAYLAGAVSGAAFFGYLTDRLGRKLLFNVTLGLYLVAAALTAFSWSLLELCPLPVPHRRRHWRRVHRDQFGDPGVVIPARMRG